MPVRHRGGLHIRGTATKAVSQQLQMKIPRPKSIALALAAACVSLVQGATAFAAVTVPPLAQQTNITEVVQANPEDSFLKATLSGVPAGYTVTNGDYLDWCIDSDVDINPGVSYNARLYSSLDIAGLTAAGIPTANLDKVNWILNNKPVGANALTIQYAIYSVLGQQAGAGATLIVSNSFAGFGFANYDPAASAALAAAANANGAGFVPGAGQIVGVISDLPASINGGRSYQRNIIEVLDPPLGSIGDTVFCDKNENGVQDPGETGIPGVKVNIVGNTANGPYSNSKVTDQFGKYLFTNLEAGSYTVTVDASTAPPDCSRTIPNCPLTRIVQLAQGQVYLDADFCFAPRLGEIGDTVFCDKNGNGIQEVGDHGIPGVKVSFTGFPLSGGTITGSQFTDANGKYLFTNLPAGTYSVSVDKSTAPADCSIEIPQCPTTIAVTLGLGQSYLDADFCFTQPPPGCALAVSAFCSVPGPATSTDECKGSKIKSIKMVYTAEGCGASFNDQPAGKWFCTGAGTPDNTVWIKVTDKSTPTDSKAKVWFQGAVSKNGTYTISAAAGGATTLAANTYIYIYKSDKTTLQQSVGVHTSCSQPIATGNQFGANLIVQLSFADGRTTTLTPPEMDKDCVITQTPAAICPPGSGNKIKSLQLVYTKENCSFSANSQPAAKWSCADSGPLLNTVYILVSDKSSPTDSKAKKWFEGTVSVGGIFTASAANGGATTLAADTYIYIFASKGGARLQTIKLHTSCSQPLNAGDQFGSIVIFSADTTGGTITLGTDVKFTYLVTNTGTTPITNVVVTDSFGTVPGSPIASIAPNQVVSLTRTVTLTADTVNTVTVSSSQAGCQDTDVTTITFVPPPPAPKDCTAAIQKTLLKYTGPNVNGPVTVSFLGSSGATASYSFPGGLLSGTTLSAPSQNNWTIDSTVSGQTSLGTKLTISINGVPEVHHTSCSTPYRTGYPAPLDNPKGQPSVLWFVVDFVSK